MNDIFRKLAHWTSRISGTPWVFMLALVLIAVWALTGPFFGFSTTWQLVVNTGTTIITFLMVFLIQNTQNRDAHAVHLKLDELIRAVRGARDQLIDIEDSADEVIESFQQEFDGIRKHHEEHRKNADA